ncbi:MAG: helix-turn-helix transcriptional regulator [Mucilaginibacter sp.]|nr:helix-turn-helix transcriptional regulator [Mucilaginibacter sp.]
MNKLIKTDIGLSVGKSIRNLRELKGWNQEIIAKRLNISIPAFSKIETGVTDVNLSRLEQIALIFELNVANLVSDCSKQTPISRPNIDLMLKKLAESDTEIVILQGKIIRLYEEIHGIS